MAKYISQETFDNVVWENIKEFEMSPEEALEDAIEQFQAQGVDLSRILKDVKTYKNENSDDGSGDLSVKVQIENILKVLNCPPNNNDNVKLKLALNDFKLLCDIGIAERCMATQLGAYPALISLLKHLKTIDKKVPEDTGDVLIDSILDELLSAFASYINQQPDCVDEDGLELLVSLFDDSYRQISQTDTSVISQYSLLLARCSTLLDIFTKLMFMHEKNKCSLLNLQVHSNSLLLVKHINSEHTRDTQTKDTASEGVLTSSVCVMLCALVRDDDIRVPFGKSYQRALSIANDCQAIGVLLNAMQKFKNDSTVCGDLLLILGSLCVCEDVCVQVFDLKGLDAIFCVLVDPMHDKHLPKLVKAGLQLMKCLCASDKLKKQVMAYDGAAQTIANLMEEHLGNAGVCEVACSLVACLALRHPQHARTMVLQCNVHQIICRVMSVHSSVVSVQRACSMAIRNIVVRNDDLIPSFLDLGVEKLLRASLEEHGSKCRDEVVYALRDLNCEVQLRELWTGTGKHLDP